MTEEGERRARLVRLHRRSRDLAVISERIGGHIGAFVMEALIGPG
jgi:hypothetical protein